MGGAAGACRVLGWKTGERTDLEDLDVDGRIMLKCVF